MKARTLTLFLAGALRLAVEDAGAATFTVTNTNSTGAGSLQQALLDANANAGADLISFNIPGNGPHVISPTGPQPLPTITGAVTIDGYTQTNASPNTLSNGFNAVLKIQIDGASSGGIPALTLAAGSNVVRGLSITRFNVPSGGINILSTSHQNIIEGNLLGVDPANSAGTDYGNANGIFLTSSAGNLIGGPNAAARNVISDNSQYGIYLQGGGAASNNVIQGNWIGLSVAGARRGNSAGGVNLLGVPRNVIGGTSPAMRNVISGNLGAGVTVELSGATNNLVQGNFIGTDATGLLNAFNSGPGVLLSGGFGNTVSGNTIAFNSSAGVWVLSGTGNAVRSNSIFGNALLGIDLETSGVTANDAGDGDGGANLRQNYPVITNAIVTRTNVVAQGFLNSAANTTFQLDFFANTSCDSSGNGEGEAWLASVPVTTDSTSNGTFQVSLGSWRNFSITATATDPNGNTSEFSPCFLAVATAPPITLTVTNANDSGPGSLRQALLDVDAEVNTGNDTLLFNIPGGGVQTIHLLSALPTPLDPVTIDGYSQPGAGSNTLVNANNAALRIELDGSALPPGANGLSLTAASNVVRGLILNRFPAHGLLLGGNGNKVEGNFIGTGPRGTNALGNTGNGVLINNGSNNIIGGTAPGAANLISGNVNFGIEISGDSATNNRVYGNIIGTDPATVLPLGNQAGGVHLTGNARFSFVGNTNSGSGNIIAHNGGNGVWVDSGDRHLVFNNLILGNALQPVAVTGAANGGIQPPTITRVAPGSTIMEGTCPAPGGGARTLQFSGFVPNVEGVTTNVVFPLGDFTLAASTFSVTNPIDYLPGRRIFVTTTQSGRTSGSSGIVITPAPTNVDLQITKTAVAMPGVERMIIYTLTITNAGPANAHDVGILEADPLLLSGEAKLMGGDGAPVTVPFLNNPGSFDLPAGSSTQATVMVLYPRTGNVTNIARVVGSAEEDSNPGNNQVVTTTFLPNPSPPTGTPQSTGNRELSGTGGDPINTSTGELLTHLPPDLTLRGPMPLFFQRYYASRIKSDGRIAGRLGDNWLHNFELLLTNRLTTVDVVSEFGRLISFTNVAGNFVLIGTTNIPFQLLTNAGNFILGDPRTQRLYTFSASGQLLTIEDGRGNMQTLAYSGTNLVSVSDGLGRVLSFQYDPTGFLTNVSDGARSVGFAQTGNLTSARDALGFVTAYTYDLTNALPGLMTATIRPQGNVPFSQVFNSLGRVISQTEAGSNVTTLSYVANVTTLVDPLGNSRKDTHTAFGRLIGSQDEATNTMAMTYNPAGQRIIIVDRQGNATFLAYHAPSGQFSAITNADGTSTTFTYTSHVVGGLTFYDLAQITYADGTSESFTFDANGNVLTRTDCAGQVHSFTYNARGQRLTAQNPLGGVTTMTYNADGTLATVADTDTGVTSFQYDAFSRLTNVIHPDGSTLQTVYDANDRVTSLTDERTNTFTFAYDGNGNVTNVTDPLSKSAQFAYDTRDRVRQTVDRLGRASSRSYDKRSQLAAVTNRNGNAKLFGYDARRRLTSVTDPGNQVWSFDYDPEALLASSANPLDQTNRIRRDALGYETGFTNALGQSGTLVRDTLRRVSASVDALSRTNEFGYDTRGLLTNSSQPAAGTAGYQRNALGLLSRITDLNGSQWHLGYTPMGRATFLADPLNRTNRYSYDSRGRPVRTVFADGSSVTNTFDPAGNLTRRQHSDGTDQQFSYDALNRLVTANELGLAYDAEGRVINTASSGVNFGAGYDAGGWLTNVTYNAGAFSVTYTYDSRDRLVSVSDSLTGTALNFSYDNAGRLVSVTRPNGVNGTYAYDAAGRLTRIQEGGLLDLQYTLDPAGQVTNLDYAVPLDPTNGLSQSLANWTHDAAHQISNAGYVYDARGRLTAAPGKAFQYDDASRLRQINAVTLGYNGLNDIVTRTEGGVTSRYFYNLALGLKPIVAEKNENTGQILRYYVWSPGGRLLYLIDAANGNAVRHFHFDRVGTTLALTDAAGAVTDAYAYTPFGELLARTGSSSQPFLYVGRYGVRHEPAANLAHMRARWYEPVSGRFLSPDPVWPRLSDPLALDPYQYAVNNPLAYVDPLGLVELRHAANQWISIFFPDRTDPELETAETFFHLQAELSEAQNSSTATAPVGTASQSVRALASVSTAPPKCPEPAQGLPVGINATAAASVIGETPTESVLDEIEAPPTPVMYYPRVMTTRSEMNAVGLTPEEVRRTVFLWRLTWFHLVFEQYVRRLKAEYNDGTDSGDKIQPWVTEAYGRAGSAPPPPPDSFLRNLRF